MKFLIFYSVVACLLAASNSARIKNVLCYFDSSSFIREGFGKFSNRDLINAMQYCSHFIYGYVGIKPDTFEVYSINEDVDIGQQQFSKLTEIKRKNPAIKILLSVGGDKDIEQEGHNKYIELLEADRVKQNSFINSAYQLVRNYGFDGLDLSFQFPKNKPRKVQSDAGPIWKKFKKPITDDYIVDPQSEMHKEQFTAFVQDVRNALKPDNLILSLTVLPNVNSSWYFDIPAIVNNLDLITLSAFDFVTPDRNPEEADYSAPLYESYDQNRLSHYNVDFQVNYWLSHQCPANKLIVGIPTYGRAWKMTLDSGDEGKPIVPKTEGPSPAGMQSQKPGLLSWPEVCKKLPIEGNTNPKGADAILNGVSDPERYGNYAFRPADTNSRYGMWVSYEDAYSAGNKADYIRSKNLGGAAVIDLSYDDFHGVCDGVRYPILFVVKYRL